MSSFLVQDKTIDNILSWIYTTRTQESFITRKASEILDIDLKKDFSYTELGQRMVALNQQALQARYGDELQPIDYKFHLTLASPVQAFKSLRCWLYQCSEGNIDETNLYKFFDEIVLGTIANRIIEKLPAYENADWD